MLPDIEGHSTTHFIIKFQTNKNTVKSVKILKIRTFYIGSCSNIALNNIKKPKKTLLMKKHDEIFEKMRFQQRESAF